MAGTRAEGGQKLKPVVNMLGLGVFPGMAEIV